jgi:uridylate kinase
VALRFAEEIRDAHKAGVQIAVVVGGGNIFRGAQGESEGMDRTPADQFGMLATICNGIVLRDMLERKCGISVRLMSALEVNKVAEPYIVQRATRHLQNGHVIILAGGTGNPFFTTDTAAALRASEIKADLLLKATLVDGIYDKDPRKHPDAIRFEQVSYDRCLTDRLEVFDAAAFDLCRSQKVPIRAFSILEAGNITRALMGESIGTLVTL